MRGAVIQHHLQDAIREGGDVGRLGVDPDAVREARVKEPLVLDEWATADEVDDRCAEPPHGGQRGLTPVVLADPAARDADHRPRVELGGNEVDSRRAARLAPW